MEQQEYSMTKKGNKDKVCHQVKCGQVVSCKLGVVKVGSLWAKVIVECEDLR